MISRQNEHETGFVSQGIFLRHLKRFKKGNTLMLLHRSLALVTALLLSVSLGRAADLDRYLPEDTESVLNINVRQLLDSELVKKHVLEVAQEALRGNDQAQDILKDLGFDPFKDLDRILVAAPVTTEKDRGLVIIHGRFNVAKFRAKADEVAKDEADHLKIHKVLGGKHILYEVNHPELDDPVFVAIPNDDTLLVSPGKDYVVDALKKSGKEAKATLKNKKFQALLEKVDARQSISLAAVANKDIAKAIEKTPGDIKGMLEKIQALAGGLTISDEIKLELAVTTPNDKDAKELTDSAKAGLNLILGFAAAITQNGDNPGADLIVESIKSLSIKNKEDVVVIKGRISSDLIEDSLKKKDSKEKKSK
ncbi:MAG TPA: hypothetical protein VH592_02070 [Gemmataceae bacterium]